MGSTVLERASSIEVDPTKQRSGVALHTRAKFATLRSLLYIHTDLSFARLSGIGGVAQGVCNG